MKGFEQLCNDVAYVRIDAVGLVEVAGPDALKFLQALVSQDLDGIGVGETRHSLLLEPQGKLTADFHVVRVAEDMFWLRCEPEVGPLLAVGLARFKIRVDVRIEDCSARYQALVVRGPNSVGVAPNVPDGVHVATIDWPTSPGHELLGPTSLISSMSIPDVTEADLVALETLRIELGVARQPADIDADTIAQEAALEVTAVSFTKGCFLGQELVCRIDSRGHVNKTMRRLRPSVEVSVGDEVVNLDGKVVGVVSSSAVSPRCGPVALATLRREVEQGAALRVSQTTTITLD